jgi:hypothetical protein
MNRTNRVLIPTHGGGDVPFSTRNSIKKQIALPDGKRDPRMILSRPSS